jgi:hypothetical protein
MSMLSQQSSTCNWRQLQHPSHGSSGEEGELREGWKSREQKRRRSGWRERKKRKKKKISERKRATTSSVDRRAAQSGPR